jgi:2,4-diketo-3-deoxy-L-fuconate hydrolase
MKLVSFGPFRAEQPGVLRDDGTILPLASLAERHGIPRAGMNEILANWDTLRGPIVGAVAASSEGIDTASVRLGAPVPKPSKVIAIGFNYPSHTAEVLDQQPPPGPPVLFLKPPTSVSGPTDSILRPPETSALDYEVELGVVIGRAGYRIARRDALKHVAGYTLANDVTARDIAFGAGLEHPMLIQIARGKGSRTFCPLGPWLLTADEVDDPTFRLELSVNGEQRQSASTAGMAVDIAGIIESVSLTMELLPGDVILTGTPAGCGFQMDPPRYLAAGDVVMVSSPGLGSMTSLVEDEIVASLTDRTA